MGMTKISRQTVVNILKRHNLDPGPNRGPGTWDELLKMHAETLWQCDFFSKRVVSRFRIRQVFAMVFINVATRRVHVSPSTGSPTTEWVADQARKFIEHAEKSGLPLAVITRDNDRLYRQFDETLAERGVRAK